MKKNTNNFVIGYESGWKLLKGSNNFILGNNSGKDLINESNQVRIGHNINETYDDCIVFDKGRVVISKEVLEMLFNKPWTELGEKKNA